MLLEAEGGEAGVRVHGSGIQALVRMTRTFSNKGSGSCFMTMFPNNGWLVPNHDDIGGRLSIEMQRPHNQVGGHRF